MGNNQSHISLTVIELGDGRTGHKAGVSADGYWLGFYNLPIAHAPGSLVEPWEFEDAEPYLIINFHNVRAIEGLVSAIVQTLEHVRQHEEGK